MYCQNCGASVSSNANFCPNCGKSLSTTSLSTAFSSTIASSGNGDYRLVLVDNGTCSKNNTEELLCDLLGYNEEDADRFVEYAPVEVADNLSELQARTLAQVFTEYGCQMLVMDESGDVVDITNKADSSVFDLDGNLLAKAAAVIGGLTLLNKVTSYRRYKKTSLLERVFRPRYKVEPPKPRRHRPTPPKKPGLLEMLMNPKPKKPAHKSMTPRPNMGGGRPGAVVGGMRSSVNRPQNRMNRPNGFPPKGPRPR